MELFSEHTDTVICNRCLKMFIIRDDDVLYYQDPECEYLLCPKCARVEIENGNVEEDDYGYLGDEDIEEF